MPRRAEPRPLTLLTDYGPGGEHVGALHLVLARECPGAERIDLAHDIPPGDVRWGALTLARHSPALAGAVHLAVVDPGVGGPRRAAALALEDGSFAVGPDNGLLGLLGAAAAVDLGAPPAGSAATFHGRDLFAPAAARLSRGDALHELGPPVALDEIEVPDLPRPTISPGRVAAMIAGRDRFGNVSLIAARADLAAAGLEDGPSRVRVGERGEQATIGHRFGDAEPGGLLVYEDSNAALSIARRDGDAWELFGCRTDESAVITGE